MKKIHLLCMLLAVPALLTAQTNVEVKYEGKPLGKTNSVKVTFIEKMPREYDAPFQGMDIYKNYMLSLQHFGMANVYKINGKKIKKKGQFKLGSFNDRKTPKDFNHANVASFSRQFLNKGDKLPLLYVTRCNGVTYCKGMQQVLFVEHVDPVNMKSEWIQTIGYDDSFLSTRHTTQWCVDTENNMLYGLGNSKENPNRHFIIKFKMPEYRGPQDSIVLLKESDVLERYFIEDYYKRPDWQPLIQGMYIRDNLLYLPWGSGRSTNPSVIYVWDLKNRCMQNAINVQNEIPHELEDGSFYGKKILIVQASSGHVYKIDL